ncbi:MAG: hypothetical protein HY265_06330 [Deltaproteobacteria bacterium]|nr:hypothetical protein [Deltaproteobacteria bacterium]
MNKNKGKIVNPNQMSLIDLLVQHRQATQSPGAFDIETRLKEEASLALRKCRLSRYEVAAKMSEMLGDEVTKSMLDNRTAESKENQMWPAKWLAPFAIITGHYEQINIINRLAKIPLVDSEKLVEIEIEKKRHIIAEEQKELEDLVRIKNLWAGKEKK